MIRILFIVLLFVTLAGSVLAGYGPLPKHLAVGDTLRSKVGNPAFTVWEFYTGDDTLRIERSGTNWLITGANRNVLVDSTMYIRSNSVDSLNVVDLGLQLGDLAASGASSGEVAKWNGSKWAPATDEGAGGALTYFTEADDNDSSIFTATAPNTVVGFNDPVTLQGNTLTGVGASSFEGNMTLDAGSGESPYTVWTDGGDGFFEILKYDAGPVTLWNSEGPIHLQAGDFTDYLSISTASDNVTLEVIAGGSGDLSIKAAGGDIDFDDENLTTTGTITVPIVIGGTGTTSDLSLKTTSDAGATGADMHFLVGNNGATEAMTILNNGRVGIGTNSPNGTLEVQGPNAGNVGGFAAGALQVTQTSAAQFTPAVITGHNSYSGNTQLWYLGSMSSANDDICFMNRQDAELGLFTNNTKRLTITNAGYVGIGDETPIALLTVGDGDVFQVSATGNVVADGNLSVGNSTTSAGVLTILEDDDDGSNFASFTVPALTANTVYTLPADDGDNTEQLTTDGSGVLSWAAAAGALADDVDTTGTQIAAALGGRVKSNAMTQYGITFAADPDSIISSANLTDGQFIVGRTGEYPRIGAMSGDGSLDNTGVLTISEDAIVPLNLVDSNVAAKGDFVAIAGTGAAFDEFGFYSPAEVLTAIGGLAVEINDLESDGANGIATTEIFIGNAANAGTYTALSGDVTMNNVGDVTITSVDADVVLLNEIGDPDGNTLIAMGAQSIVWSFNTPVSEGFEILMGGNFTDHALHVHQTGGNPSTVHLVHFESADPDVLPLCVTTAGRDSVAAFIGGEVFMDSLDVDGKATIDSLEVAGVAATGDLDVTGTITVSSTVDGVDLAALNTGVAADSGSWNEAADKIDTLHFIFAMSDPNALYDTDVRFCFKPVLPSAITITRIDVTCDAVPGTEPAMSLKYADAFIGLANAVTIDVITTTAGVTAITSGFDDATIATGKALYFEFTADPEAALKSITVDMAYTVD